MDQLLYHLIAFLIFGVIIIGGLSLLVIITILTFANIIEEEKASEAYMREKISSWLNEN